MQLPEAPLPPSSSLISRNNANEHCTNPSGERVVVMHGEPLVQQTHHPAGVVEIVLIHRFMESLVCRISPSRQSGRHANAEQYRYFLVIRQRLLFLRLCETAHKHSCIRSGACRELSRNKSREHSCCISAENREDLISKTASEIGYAKSPQT